MIHVACINCSHEFSAQTIPEYPRLEADCPKCGKRNRRLDAATGRIRFDEKP